MNYRYYVHDTKENVGVTEFNSSIPGYFAECLCDCIDWFMWESDNTCLYEFKVFIDDEEWEIKFRFDEDDELVADFYKDGLVHTVCKDRTRDFVKSNM